MNKNGIEYTERSDAWNNGYTDGIMGYGQDYDYVQEIEYTQDIEEYLDGFLMGLDAYDIMSSN